MEQSLPESLAVLRIHKNPWSCDCTLRWLRRWIDNPKEVENLGRGSDGLHQSQSTGHNEASQSLAIKKKKFRVSWDFASNTPICASPPLIKGVAWKYLTQDQFACPGRIVLTNTTVSVKERQNATLECLYSGDPTPKVTWKNHQLSLGKAHHFQIISTTKMQSNPGEFHGVSILHETPVEQRRHRQSQSRTSHASLHPSSVLVIPLVQVNQSGDYTCIVENSAGRAEATFKLVVLPDQPQSSNSTQEIALQLENSEIWKTESILGMTASFVILTPLLVFTILLWLIKRRKQQRTGKRKNPFNRSLAVPLTEKSNEVCVTDDDDDVSNDGECFPLLVRVVVGNYVSLLLLLSSSSLLLLGGWRVLF